MFHARRGRPDYKDRRRASSNVTPPSATNSTVPIIASGVWPVPPKYTASAIETAAATPQLVTSALDGLEVIPSL
jgi:hypothetical protein